MWQRLLQDPAFRRAVKTRYQVLRRTVLSNQAIDGFIDRQAQLLANAKDHHFQTYPELLVSEERKQEPRAAETRRPPRRLPSLWRVPHGRNHRGRFSA